MKPIVRVFSNFSLSDFEKEFVTAGITRRAPSARVVFNVSGRASFAIVLNATSGFHFAHGPNLRTLKVLMEPKVEGSVFHQFTRRHSIVFDKVLCHNADPKRQRELASPPMIPPHAVRAFHLESPPQKTKLVSAIGSKLTDLPLHRLRSEFLDSLESDDDIVEVFGKGRAFLEDKSDGLLPYMYSIAIENTVSDNYWTEKLSDCFLAWTVPIYVGDPSVAKVFPKGSIIHLDSDDLLGSWKRIVAGLSPQDYAGRFDSISRARAKVVDTYNLGEKCMDALMTLDASPRAFWRFSVLTTASDITTQAIIRLASIVRQILRGVRSSF